MADTPPPDDQGLNDVIFTAGGLRVTFRLARLIALWWLSTMVLAGCFWIILEPGTTEQIDTVAASLVVTIVTAWITATATNAR